MKKAFVYGLLVALAITGCQAELEEVSNNEPDVISQETTKVFTAIVDEDFNSETKTSLDGSGNVLWKKGDQVSIFAASTVNEQYQVSDDSDGKTAATLNKIPGGGFVAGGEIDNNVAFYPYASTAEIAKSGSNYVISKIELPATQTYAASSFGNGAFPMATVTSSTEDMNLKFKNVLGGLKLQLKGTATITSITVTGNNNEILCGDAKVTTTYGGVPSIVLTDASAKTVTLDCGAGVTLDSETATPFIIALPPMTMTGGFTVVVTDTEGKQMQIKTTKPQTITRSNLLKMPAVNYVGIDVYSSEAFTITSTGSTSVSIKKVNSPANITLEYRKGTDSWTAYTINTVVDLLNGECIQFRAGEGGNESFSTSESDYYNINVSGEGTVNLSGNIMSLLDRSLLKDSVPSYAFSKFCYCGKIVDASNLKLPATTLADHCYSNMFQGCTKLTTAPELPATTLADYCYSNMFENCTSLTTAPELPATTLAKYCYSNMFRNCSSLTTAPELPATTLATDCYSYMFFGCTDLTTAPELPATTLADYCYSYMFFGCRSLTTAPELPATTLKYGCYEYMFSGCRSLTTAPELPATTLAIRCYIYMFLNCSNLNYIKALFTTKPSSMYTEDWVKGVAATGTFVKGNSATWDVVDDNGVPSGWTIETPLTTPLKFTSTGSTSISLTKRGSPDDISLDYKVNDGGWTSYTVGDAINLTDGQELSFRAGAGGNSSFSKDIQNNYQFTVTGSGTVAASGNIMSLLNRGERFIISTPYCFYGLFLNCSKLTSAPELPATTLANYCYKYMFCGCTGLTTAPELPATTLAQGCYESMFYGCTGLTTAPELPATTLAQECYVTMFTDCTSLTTAPKLPATTLLYNCYFEMFRDCTSLTTAPKLPATTLARKCYDGMFWGCTSLTTAPKLPATTLADYCYQYMFCDCTSLTTAPELPATTLAQGCYNSMFNGCTSLTTAPELPATTLVSSCYNNMFNGCIQLNYIKALFTTIPSDSYTHNWVNSVAATGTFVKSSSANWKAVGSSAVPSGWTVITE